MKLPHRRRFLHLAAGAAALPTVSRVARAQAYPTRPVRWIVPYPPGGAADPIARLIGPFLSERLGKPVVIENKPGAGANIGTEFVVRSPPDGHTLLFITTANMINATFYRDLSFDFMRDITPVAGLVRLPLVLEVNPSVRSPNSLPTPRPIQARSISRRRAWVPRSTSPPSCSI